MCPDCQKSKVTSLEPFISKFCNYSNDICERGLLYDYIGLLSYEKKGEMIYLEHGVKIPRQTTYYHESNFSEAFLKRQEKMNAKLLKQKGIKPTGYYNYDGVRQDRAFSPITSVKFFNLKDFNPCCLGFPPSKFLSW